MTNKERDSQTNRKVDKCAIKNFNKTATNKYKRQAESLQYSTITILLHLTLYNLKDGLKTKTNIFLITFSVQSCTIEFRSK